MENNSVDQGSLRDLLSVIFKHKVKIGLIFLVVSVIGIAVSFLVSQDVYEATAKILVKIGRENVYTVPIAGGSSPVIIDSAREQRMNSEMQLLQTRNLSEKVIRKIGLEKIYPRLVKSEVSSSPSRTSAKKLSPFEKAVLLFGKSLTVADIKRSDIIEVNFQHEDPVIAADVVNNLIDIYMDQHIKIYGASGLQNVFEDRMKLLERKMNQDRNELDAFRRQNNISSLQEQKTLLLKQISDQETELSKTRSEINENLGKLHAMEDKSYSPAGEVTLGQETDINPNAISPIRTKLAELQLKEKDLLNRYTEESIAVANVRKEIEAAKELLAKEERTYHDKAVITTNQTLKAIGNKEENQRRDLARYQQELNRLNNLEMQYTELEQQLKRDEESYQLYGKKIDEAKMSDAMDVQKIVNVSVVQPALPPITPIKKQLMRNIGLSIFFGLFAGFGAAFVLEFLRHTFKNREDVEKHLGLPVLASIPERE